ncbi:MAG: glycosyltransferase [bacterium]|nr:glycosyltransferase [bacterium]
MERTSETPRVTVLTTVYNGLPYLTEAIESTLAQTYSDFEYLIIDDASPDSAVVPCIRSYTDSRIRLVVHAQNMGTARTMNDALAYIRTPYVVRLDQDDVSMPTRIAEQLQMLDARPDLAAVCSWERTIDAQGHRVRTWKRTLADDGDALAYILMGLCPIWHPSLMFRTDALRAIGGFRPEYSPAEDFDVTARFVLARMGIGIVPEVLVLQRDHGRRQSVRGEHAQTAMAHHIHEEAMSHASGEVPSPCLAAFLRLEQDPCGLNYTRAHLLTIVHDLARLLDRVQREFGLSPDAQRTLQCRVVRRLGFGVRYAEQLSVFPDAMFSLMFFALSPQFVPHARRAFARGRAAIHALRRCAF